MTALTPAPLPLRQAYESTKQKSLAPFERQAFSLVGVKAEPETGAEVRTRETEGMNLEERGTYEAERKKTLPPRTTAEKTAAASRAVEAVIERGPEQLKRMSKPDRQWVESRGLSLPGYNNRLRVEGKDVSLSKQELERFSQIITEEDTKALATVRGDWNQITDDERHVYFHDAIKEARATARERLIEELNSKSESNKKAKKRSIIFDTSK